MWEEEHSMKTMEEKQNAVLTLLEDSVLLTYEQKMDLIENFPLLTEEQIDALGAFLASEEKIREEFGEDIQAGVQKVLKQITGEQISWNEKNVYVGTGRPSTS
jgi:hypothetical protein